MADAYPWQDSLWQQLAGRAQHAHAYLLHGPAGIGKRALGREIETQARGRGWAVLRAEATETGRPYGLIADIAERLIFEDRSVLDRIGSPARSVLAQAEDLPVAPSPAEISSTAKA